MKYIYLFITLIVMLTACNPVATQTTVAAINTETPPAASTPVTSTSTVSSADIEVSYPTFTPAPTPTSIPMLRPGQPLKFANIYMMDKQTGWGIEVEGHIVHTNDGGNSWKDVTPPNSNGIYQSGGFFALDADTAWATPYQDSCYSGACANSAADALWHTTDGGETWQGQHLCLLSGDCGYSFDVDPSWYDPKAIQFLDEKTGWVLVVVNQLMFQARYRLYGTQDGGMNWSLITDSKKGPLAPVVTGLAFLDAQVGWLGVSEIDSPFEPQANWNIYQSGDAGQTWDEIQFPEPNPLPETFAQHTAWCGVEDVEVLPPDSVGVTILCWVYEESSRPSYYFYYHSSDGGNLWISWQKTGDVQFIDASVGWRLIAGNGAYDLEQTRDGGMTWTKIKTMQWSGDLDFINDQVGWALATSGDVVALVHTTDGGQTWEEIKPVVAAP